MLTFDGLYPRQQPAHPPQATPKQPLRTQAPQAPLQAGIVYSTTVAEQRKRLTKNMTELNNTSLEVDSPWQEAWQMLSKPRLLWALATNPQLRRQIAGNAHLLKALTLSPTLLPLVKHDPRLLLHLNGRTPAQLNTILQDPAAYALALRYNQSPQSPIAALAEHPASKQVTHIIPVDIAAGTYLNNTPAGNKFILDLADQNGGGARFLRMKLPGTMATALNSLSTLYQQRQSLQASNPDEQQIIDRVRRLTADDVKRLQTLSQQLAPAEQFYNSQYNFRETLQADKDYESVHRALFKYIPKAFDHTDEQRLSPELLHLVKAYDQLLQAHDQLQKRLDNNQPLILPASFSIRDPNPVTKPHTATLDPGTMQLTHKNPQGWHVIILDITPSTAAPGTFDIALANSGYGITQPHRYSAATDTADVVATYQQVPKALAHHLVGHACLEKIYVSQDKSLPPIHSIDALYQALKPYQVFKPNTPRSAQQTVGDCVEESYKRLFLHRLGPQATELTYRLLRASAQDMMDQNPNIERNIGTQASDALKAMSE